MSHPCFVRLITYAIVASVLAACVGKINVGSIPTQNVPTSNPLVATPLQATPFLVMTKVTSVDMRQATEIVRSATATAEASESVYATKQASVATATLPSASATLSLLSNATVNTSALNLRDGPGTIYPKVQNYKSGTVIKVLGKEPAEQWLKVETPDGKVGWMSTKYLRFSFNLSDVPVAEVPPTPLPPG